MERGTGWGVGGFGIIAQENNRHRTGVPCSRIAAGRVLRRQLVQHVPRKWKDPEKDRHGGKANDGNPESSLHWRGLPLIDRVQKRIPRLGKTVSGLELTLIVP
jgi:hypothetical protein